MKGIILAGGSGTRLYPATVCVSKQLMPVFDKPMIYYPLATLMLADIKEILIISTPRDVPLFKTLLGNGSQWGIKLSYATQAIPAGLPDAFLVGEKFIGEESVCLVLGDNIFHGKDLTQIMQNASKRKLGATIFAYPVRDPERYGVIEFDKMGKVISIEEKPQVPKSKYAITGMYFFDRRVVKFAKSLRPSARGELEITDLMQPYLQAGNLRVELLNQGMAWLDTGTPRALLDAATYVAVLEERQGLKIASPEEIAWRRGFISTKQLQKLANAHANSIYGQYLKNLSSAHAS